MTGEKVASEPAAAWCGERGAPGAQTQYRQQNEPYFNEILLYICSMTNFD